jgi:hypothetical protein
MKCRHCKLDVEQSFLDLGTSPPSNAYLTQAALLAPEIYFPLRVLVCTRCWLVQTQDFARADELFSSDYAYLSSVSQSWLAHAAAYAEMIKERLQLGRNSFVIEVASNDGYLLRNSRRVNVDVVSDDEVGLLALRCELLRERHPKKLAKNGDSLLLRCDRRTDGRFDTQARNASVPTKSGGSNHTKSCSSSLLFVINRFRQGRLQRRRIPAHIPDELMTR